MNRKSYLLLAFLACLLLLLALISRVPIDTSQAQTQGIISVTSLPPGWWARYNQGASTTTDYPVVGMALLSTGEIKPIILQSTGFSLAPETNLLGFCYVPEERACLGDIDY